MPFGKVALSLYDLLGYLFPGVFIVIAFSAVEATFFGSSLLTIERLQQNWLISIAAAYIFGHALHAVGSKLQSRFWKQLTTKDKQLGNSLYYKIKSLVQERHGFTGEEMEDLLAWDLFLLCDAHTVMSKGSVEREMILSKEGFYRGLFLAFAVLTILLIFATIFGGVHWFITDTDEWAATRAATFSIALVSSLMSWLMLERFKMFNRMKNNFSKLVYFLATEYEAK